MDMLFRLLSGIGAIAHLGDAIIAPFVAFKKPGDRLVAAGARLAGALAIAVVLLVGACVALVAGDEGAANTQPTTYTVSQLASTPDLNGRVYATVTAALAQDYVRVTKDGTYAYSEYIVGDTNSGKCLIVESKHPETEMDALVAEDGTVTLTGMLRTDTKEIKEALDTLGTTGSAYDVNKAVLLKEGDTPANPTLMYAITGTLTAVAAVLLIGWGIGYLVFRPTKPRTSLMSTGMAEPIPVHVTGLIPSYMNGVRAREMQAELRLAQLLGEIPAGEEPPVDLVYRTRQGNRGLRLMPGTAKAAMGKAYPLKGSRPAIRLKFDKYKLILSFDNELARDQAFDQIKLSGHLNPTTDGAVLSAQA
jgi:hypothetical protein